MLLPILIGFLIGLMLPATAGRFGKILPADPGRIILNLWHRPHFPKGPFVTRSKQLKKKWAKMILFSLIWGGILGELFWGSYLFLDFQVASWICIFITIVAFCIIIDAKYCLLPDFFTIPLLVIGFGFAVFTPVLSPAESFIGAVAGYFIATFSMIMMGKKSTSEIGAGDVKMITAIGAWLGVLGLNFALLLSFFFFAIPITFQGQKRGAYGPALGISAIIAFFILYMN